MSQLPILYSFRRCPYAMRARMALAASGLRYELREVVLKSKPEAMLLASPKGTVPVLVLPDGTVIEESLDIMRWSLHAADPLVWLSEDTSTCLRWDQWIAQCDGEFKLLLDRYKYPDRFGEQRGDTFRDQALPFLQNLNHALEGEKYLGGKRFGMVDAAIAPFVRQFAHTDKAWFAGQTLSSLQSWLHTFENSTLFGRVMEKHAPWIEGQPAVIWPSPTNELTNGNEIMTV